MPSDTITQQSVQELISSDVQEIISYRPHWIVRKGNTIFLLILLFLLTLTFFIKYPDIVNASARLVAINPPKAINARTEGKLIKLFVTNEQDVKKDQPLAVLESTGNYDEIVHLHNWIEQVMTAIQNDKYEIIKTSPLPLLSNLGELQGGYQIFQNELEQTKQTLASGYYQQKRNALQKDIQYLSVLKGNAQQQQQLIEKDQQLQVTEYNAYESLAKDKVIAPLELNQYKSKLIAKEQTRKQVDAQITNSDINSHSKQKELMDLAKTMTDQQQLFYSALLGLKSECEKWMQQYVLTAPEDGKVFFVSSLQQNELIGNGQNLFYVESGQSQFYAELMAGQRGFGKVSKGQKVVLKVDSYPSWEFGYLSGTITYVSNIATRRDSFLLKVELPAGLKTNYEKMIFFRNNLAASAEIITDDKKLIDRLLGQLKQILDR